ncbi:BspA family leucine-rich repeat surface protein [Candidatus Saccharibacteria bacterium]|nr:BspA family leucine-rich repeat surface protein [Candidatus Saccharibacteria bacterium]
MKSYTALITNILITTTLLSGTILASTLVSADNDSVVDEINITVPESCSISGTGMDSHNANIANGIYTADIGTTTLTAFCNDNEGFAIYAAGYTGDEIGGTNSNKLVGTTASGNAAIESGLATSASNPDISNWAMKLAITQDSGDTTGTNAFTIDSAPNVALPSEAEQSATSASFSQYHVVPNEYTKVAHKNSGTDMTDTTGGVKLTTTYAAYISKTQPADTYSGQVIYTMVHPSNHATPIANPAMLDTGKVVNSKLKSVAATVVNGEETIITPDFDVVDSLDSIYASDSYIKSINIHLKTPVPADFTPSEMNTISTSTSKKPIYAVFDNTNDAGIMHFYTEGEKVFLPSDSSFMFYYFNSLSQISGISDWDTSNVTYMLRMFFNAGHYATTFNLDLSSWDTSNVTDMSDVFYYAGFSATAWSIGDLSSWDTSNVTDMSRMFYFAGRSATTFNLNLSSWNTSNVTNMGGIFNGAGRSATTWSIGGLSSWDTSNVENMSGAFNYAGYSATIFALDLSSWDTSNVTHMYRMFAYAGYSATTWSIGDLSSWNTSNLKDVSDMFNYAGYSAATFALNLSSWDTSNVTYMNNMFYYAGYSAATFALNLSSWDTSNVTDMSNMFKYAGSSATTWSVTIPGTNGNSINNTTSRLYGKTTSTYAAPPSGKSFTLAE